MIPDNSLQDNLIMTPLINCPWCNSSTTSEDHGDNGWFIGCVNVDCEIKPSFWAYDQASAIKIWNQAK